jgi:ribonuclease HI
MSNPLPLVCGEIISLGNCVGNVTRLMTRNLFSVIHSRSSWSSFVKLTSDARVELRFWKCNVLYLNGIPIWPIKCKPSKIIHYDASNSGYGIIIDLDGKVFQQNWSDFERSQSSTYRELKAVLLFLQAFKCELASQSILWYTDSKNVVSIICNGSKIPELQCLTLDIHQVCVSRAISLYVQWIPRDFNFRADEAPGYRSVNGLNPIV